MLLRINLNYEEYVLCQIDFPENYTCTNDDEIQSVYFDKGIATLHPVVIYYRANTPGEDAGHILSCGTLLLRLAGMLRVNLNSESHSIKS